MDEKQRRARAREAQADDAADKQNLFGSGKSDRGKRRPARPQGNSRQALIRRLRRDHPQLYELVLDGQLSPHRAAIAAGFRRKPGPRPKRPIDPLEEGHHEILLELWLGPGHRGSIFNDVSELRQAWIKHRNKVMALWGTRCRRPAAWWEFETSFEYPGYDDEPRFLYERGLLSEAERAQLEAQWAAERQQQSRKPSDAAYPPL